MPELPEVETVRRNLACALSGRTLVRVRLRRNDILRGGVRCRALERELTGRTVGEIGRRGKNLIIELSGGAVLLAHLGMTGRLCVVDAGVADDKHTHLSAELCDDRRLLFRDPRRFGHLEWCCEGDLEAAETLRGVGVDAMADEFTAERFAEMLAGRTAPVKAALLDQRRVAGIGNIYACEAMFRAGIPAEARCDELNDAQVRALHGAIRRVLVEAIAAEGTTIADYVTGTGVPGGFQERLRVYGREGERCRKRGCGGVIERIVQSNRSTFYCPVCQRG